MKVSDILPLPVTVAAYRYGHLYVVQGSQVLILRGGDVTRCDLDFTPQRLASFGGVVALTGEGGAATLTGTTLAAQFTGSGPYSAPLAEPVRGGVPLTGHGVWKGQDVMGMPVTVRGPVTHSPLTERTYYEPVLGALIEPQHLLTFQRDRLNFAQLNGVVGELLYCDPATLPDVVVPYVFAGQNLYGGGFEGGFVFTPDNGRSWRKRRLDGFGVLTERAVLSVSPQTGVTVVTGSFA